MNIPTNLKYAKTDEWVRVEGNIAIIGVSDYAQEQLSDVVYWEATVDISDDVQKGKPCATIESVKAASDVNAPVSGKVLEINEALANSPEKVNSNPYDAAWMFKIEMTDLTELNDLMDAASYQNYCENRGH